MTGDNGSELVLASESLRRQDLLREAGISFRVVVPSVEETLHPGEKPEECAQRLAVLKARTVARRLPRDSRALISEPTATFAASERIAPVSGSLTMA